jgi:hypothetical protein
VRKLDHYLEYVAAVLILLICLFVLVAHWFACVWYTIGFSDITEKHIKYGWLYVLANDTRTYLNTSNDEDLGVSKGMSYVTAMYFTLSCMTSVGFGNVAANTEGEKIFSIILMIVGCKCFFISNRLFCLNVVVRVLCEGH